MSDPARDLEDAVAELLLSGRATDARSAERLFLEDHLDDVVRLALSDLPEAQFRRHPLIVLLLAHGSRGWEDSIR